MMFKQDTIPDLIVKQMEEMILSGKLKPNELLPGERHMAEQFGVGKSSVREALAALEYMNIVKRTKDGIFINENVYEYANEQLSFHLLLEKERYLELIELREILECQHVRLAIKNATQEDLDLMRATITVDPDDYEQILKSDADFHLAIAEASQNGIFIQTYYKIRDVLDRVTRNLTRERVSVILSEHRAIYEAIVKKDEGSAVSAMRAHISSRRSSIINP